MVYKNCTDLHAAHFGISNVQNPVYLEWDCCVNCKGIKSVVNC